MLVERSVVPQKCSGRQLHHPPPAVLRNVIAVDRTAVVGGVRGIHILSRATEQCSGVDDAAAALCGPRDVVLGRDVSLDELNAKLGKWLGFAAGPHECPHMLA